MNCSKCGADEEDHYTAWENGVAIVGSYQDAPNGRVCFSVGEERERCAKVAESEPNLEGPMPDENWVMSQRVRLEDHLRVTVDLTKRNIAKRIRES